MSLDFPNSPSLNQVYTSGESSWIWDGSAWLRQITFSIDDNDDVTISGVTSGDFLKYNGSNWINDPVNLATDTTGSYVESLVAGTGINILNNSGESATPSISVDTSTIATKSYVDAVAVGLYWHEAVKYATAGVLPNSPNYSNGTSGVNATLSATTNGRLVVDGGNATNNDRILVKNQSNAIHNGIYYVEDQGSSTTTWVLKRAQDSDNSPLGEMKTGDAVYALSGSTNLRQGFVLTTYGSLSGNVIDIGTDEIEYTQFSGTASFTAGSGLTSSGNTLNVVTADSSRIVVNSDSVDLAVVSQTNTSGSSTTTFVSDVTVDSYGRVSGKQTSSVDLSSTIQKSIVDAKGDLIVASAADTVVRLAAGSDGYFLKANSGAANGIEWASIPTINNLDDIGDVTISSALSGDFLKWNGTAWVNDPINLGTDTTGNYMTDVSAGTGISVTHTPAEGSTATVNLNATLDNLSNVNAPSPSNGQFLKYVSASSEWQPADIPTINNLDDVGDVTITSAASGDFLKWNGSAWVNDPINLSTDTTGDYIQSLVAGTGITLTNNSGEGSTPTVAVDTSVIATKAYADSIAEGLHIHAPVKAATTASLASITGGTVTYNNGTDGVGATLTLSVALTTLDGYSLQNGNRIIVKDQATTAHNGIYTWATGGTVLTRATDYNTPTEVAGGDFTFVTNGSTYANTGWVQTNAVTTFGTDPISFLQFSGSGTFTAGTGLTLTGTQFSVNASQTQITGVGTLTAGTWNANVISSTYGGTGINNAGRTLTIATANITLTANASGSSVTLPLSGTLATLAGSETLTFKTLTSPIIDTPTLTLSTTTSTANGRIAWDGTNDRIIVGDGTNAVHFAPSTRLTNAQTASYTLVLTDKDKIIEMSTTSPTANTLTVPLNSSVAFPIGSEIVVFQTGTGQTTIAGASGVTVNATPGLKLRAQWSAVTLIKRGTDTWIAIGDLSA